MTGAAGGERDADADERDRGDRRAKLEPRQERRESQRRANEGDGRKIELRFFIRFCRAKEEHNDARYKRADRQEQEGQERPRAHRGLKERAGGGIKEPKRGADREINELNQRRNERSQKNEQELGREQLE